MRVYLCFVRFKFECKNKFAKISLIFAALLVLKIGSLLRSSF